MQWSEEKNAGFTTGTPWFCVNPNYEEINVQADLSSTKSIFRFYKELIALRKKPVYEDILIEGNTNPIYMEEDFVFAYERISVNKNEKIIVISNYQNTKFKLRFEHSFEDVLLNNYDSLECENEFLILEPYQTIVLK
jgi:oligo-1,6-glucosidase